MLEHEKTHYSWPRFSLLWPFSFSVVHTLMLYMRRHRCMYRSRICDHTAFRFAPPQLNPQLLETFSFLLQYNTIKRAIFLLLCNAAYPQVLMACCCLSRLQRLFTLLSLVFPGISNCFDIVLSWQFGCQRVCTIMFAWKFLSLKHATYSMDKKNYNGLHGILFIIHCSHFLSTFMLEQFPVLIICYLSEGANFV